MINDLNSNKSNGNYNGVNMQGHEMSQYNMGNNYLHIAKGLFFKLDRDGSGEIEMGEFPSLIEEQFRLLKLNPPSLMDCYYLMQTYDTDGNGRIDFEEYVKMVTAMDKAANNNNSGSRSQLQEKARLLFQQNDMNNKGELDMNEFPNQLTKLFQSQGLVPVDRNDCGRIMKKFDTDGNGKMDLDEYMKMVEAIEKQLGR